MNFLIFIFGIYSYWIFGSANTTETNKEAESSQLVQSEEKNTFPPLLFVCKNEECLITQFNHIKKENEESIFISACPAEGDEQIGLNNDESLTKNSLFGRIYNIGDIDESHVCKTKYEPSMLYNTKNENYEVGYEIHFNSKDKKLLSFMPKLKNMKLVTEIDNDANSTTSNKHFLWFSRLTILFNKFLVRIKQVTQTLHLYDLDTSVTQSCPHYNLGKEVFDDVTLDKPLNELFSPTYQLDFFTTEYLPIPRNVEFSNENDKKQYEKLLKTTEDKKLRNDLLCTVDRRCLKAQQLVAFEDFPSNDISSCTYMNVVAIWEDVANIPWRRVNSFIRKLATYVEKLEIITGTYDTLSLKSRKSQYLTEAKLSPNTHRIPIPKILWKLIKYPIRLKHPQPKTIYYSFFIIVHNNIDKDEVTENDRICKQNRTCEQFGCPLGRLSSRTGITYCCRVEEHILKKLDIKNFPPVSDFNLKAVDMYGDSDSHFENIKNLSDDLQAFISKEIENIIKE